MKWTVKIDRGGINRQGFMSIFWSAFSGDKKVSGIWFPRSSLNIQDTAESSIKMSGYSVESITIEPWKFGAE